jgi:hypothetical protein
MIRSLFHRSRDRALSTSLSAASKDVLRRHLTLLSPQNLQTLEQCIKSLDSYRVAGDFVQCGSEPGGVSVVLISMLSPARRFRGYTTMNGHPTDARTLDVEIGDQRISFHTVDIQSDSLSDGDRPVALAHINGSDSNATAFYLNALISRVPPGGFIVVNDHNTHDSSRAIIDHFLGRHPEFSLNSGIRSSFVLQNSRPH